MKREPMSLDDRLDYAVAFARQAEGSIRVIRRLGPSRRNVAEARRFLRAARRSLERAMIDAARQHVHGNAGRKR